MINVNIVNYHLIKIKKNLVNSRDFSNILGRPFVKRSAVSYRTVVCPVLSVLSCLKLSVMSWQTDGWIKMPLGTEVGLGPGRIVLDGNPAPPPQKRWQSRIRMSLGTEISLRPRLLWPNGWMNQDDTGYGSMPRPRRHCTQLIPLFS